MWRNTRNLQRGDAGSPSTASTWMAWRIYVNACSAASESTTRIAAKGAQVLEKDRPWEMVLTSEDPAFSPDPSPPDFDWTEQGLAIRFLRPSAVVLRRERERKLP